MAPETAFVLLLFGLVTVPLLVGAVALLNRDSNDDGRAEERIRELERRVEELGSERE